MICFGQILEPVIFQLTHYPMLWWEIVLQIRSVCERWLQLKLRGNILKVTCILHGKFL